MGKLASLAVKIHLPNDLQTRAERAREKRNRVRRQIARGSEARRTGDGAACRRRDATDCAKTRQAATGGIPTEPNGDVFALGWRIYAGCNGAESALPASRATEAPVQAWHVSVPSYENISQVGKIALAISAFRSRVLDLCRSPIRSEGH